MGFGGFSTISGVYHLMIVVLYPGLSELKGGHVDVWVKGCGGKLKC